MVNQLTRTGTRHRILRTAHRLLLAAASWWMTPFCVADDSWAGFRGDGSGITHANLPTQWSPAGGVAWLSNIPGYGQSSPVVWNDHVYVTSSDGPFQQDCQVHAFDLLRGEKLWTSHIAATTKVENYFRNSRAAPTCCVDKDGVYSFFASGDVTAMSHDGQMRWTTPILQIYGAVDNERGVASSLAQTGDRLFVLIDHHGPSYLVAINKLDGQIDWKADRGNRVPSWSSPVVAKSGKREIVITSSADTVDAYDAATGESLWQLDGLEGNHIPSATVVGDEVFVGSTTMYGGATDEEATAGSNCCIKLTNVDGMPGYEVRWGAERANSYYSTPLAFAGYVYYVNKVGVLYCIDRESGEQVFAKRIGNPCWASAVGVTQPNGEQVVYFVLKNGFTIVLRPGDAYDEVAMNQLYDAEAMMEAGRAAEGTEWAESGRGLGQFNRSCEATRASQSGVDLFGRKVTKPLLVLMPPPFAGFAPSRETSDIHGARSPMAHAKPRSSRRDTCSH